MLTFTNTQDMGERIFWPDFIRSAAIFIVVLLHSAAPLVYGFNKISLYSWFVANFYDSMSRVAVPLFFMLSGSLLLPKDEPIIVTYKKRFGRILIPLAFWSIFYIFWNALYLKTGSITALSFFSLLISSSHYHLWYLYAVLGIYICLPFLRRFVLASGNKMLIYYILIWVMAVSIVPVLEIFTGIKSKIDLSSIKGHVGYFMLGLLLSKIWYRKIHAIISFFMYITCVLFTAYLTYFFTLRNAGKLYENFYEYLSLNVILSSAAMFIVLKYLAFNFELLQIKMIRQFVLIISRCSLGIYLIHPIFLDLMKRGFMDISLSGSTGNPLISIPCTAVSAFCLSVVFVFILDKIPFAQRIIK